MERDDLFVNDSYALNAHHSEEEGVKIRKNIVKVTLILTLITAIEIFAGIKFGKGTYGGTDTWEMIKLFYILLTVVKAGYIVMIFMHLGEERRNFKMIILLPYIAFILYLVFICLTEAASVLEAAGAMF